MIKFVDKPFMTSIFSEPTEHEKRAAKKLADDYYARLDAAEEAELARYKNG